MFIYAILILLPAMNLAADPHDQLETALFTVQDTDKDGVIEKSEAETYFLSYDANKDGVISLAELTSSINKLDPQFAGHENAIYAVFDRDDDKQFTKVDVDAIFDLADTNHDNKIQRPEFHAIFSFIVTIVG